MLFFLLLHGDFGKATHLNARFPKRKKAASARERRRETGVSEYG